jgi:uncharacterized protein YndB with AHSA1/START domain
MRIVFLLVFMCQLSFMAAAAVVDSSSTGFTVQTTITIQASPDEVYRRLVHNIGDWWDPAHTFSGDSHNLSIDEKPMGCFCEKLPNQGGVRHMEVLSFAPGKSLVLSGGLGPLQRLAATGSMSFTLMSEGTTTKLEALYTVTGYLPAGMNTWAAPVDTVVSQQMARLKNYIEHGESAAKSGPGAKR